MSCKISKFDFCILQQETFKSPTFEFENTDVSNDTFVYTVFKSFGSEKKEFPVNFIDNNTVYIEDVKMPLGNYQHELLWIRNGIKEVVFQGSLKVTNKGSNCGCTSNKNIINVVNEDVVVNVNYSERVIERITDKGASAYQIAVENGFVGTEEEWLESLKLHYSDLTEAEILELQQPAIEAAQTANTAAQNADDARLAIQDELALKAFHGYDSNPKTLKEVEDNASIKIENLITNGGFESGVPSWFSTQPILSEEEKLSGDSSGYIVLANNISYSVIDIACDLNDKLYISVSRRFKSFESETTNRIAVFDFGGLENRETIAPFYNGNLDVWETTTAIVDGRTNGIRLAAGFFISATVQCFVDNMIAINLTRTFGKGSEPTKEEFELLLAILGIDYFEGEITIHAQKIMQWQLSLIRENKNDIDLVLTTENENWEV